MVPGFGRIQCRADRIRPFPVSRLVRPGDTPGRPRRLFPPRRHPVHIPCRKPRTPAQREAELNASDPPISVIDRLARPARIRPSFFIQPTVPVGRPGCQLEGPDETWITRSDKADFRGSGPPGQARRSAIWPLGCWDAHPPIGRVQTAPASCNYSTCPGSQTPDAFPNTYSHSPMSKQERSTRPSEATPVVRIFENPLHVSRLPGGDRWWQLMWLRLNQSLRSARVRRLKDSPVPTFQQYLCRKCCSAPMHALHPNLRRVAGWRSVKPRRAARRAEFQPAVSLAELWRRRT